MSQNLTLAVLALLAGFGMPAPLHAEPISGLIVASLFGPAFAGTAVGAFVTSALTLGIGVGVSLAASAFLSQQATDKPSKVQSTISASVGPRWRHYGRQLLGGSLMFIETKNGSLYQIVAFASHQISAFEAWKVDTRNVTLDGSGWVTTSPYPANVVRIESRIGAATQAAYPNIVGDFAGYWTADHRGDGIAHGFLYAGGVDAETFSEVYPNRIPSLQALVQAAEVYDPRTGTVGYSTNYALFMHDYLSHADGLQIDWSYLDDDDFTLAPYQCDELLTKKGGGTIPRYHGALSYSFDEEPQAVIGRILTNCDGDLRLKPNGKIGFSVGVWQEPTVTLTDDHIIDYTLSDGGGPLRESNEYRLKYTHPEGDWPEVEAEPWRIESEISEYGEVRSTTIEAYGVQHHNHARRLMKIAAHRGSPRWQGTIKTTLAGLRAWDERWIRVQIGDLEIDETFEVGAVEFDFETFSVTISIASFSAAAYAFDAEAEEGTAPTIPSEVISYPLDPPAAFAATGGVVDLGGGVNQPTIFVSWSAAPRKGVSLQLQYAEAGTGNWQAGPSVPTTATSAQITGLADGGVYDVRGRWAGAVTSDWAVVEDVALTSYITAPAPPTNLNTTDAGDGEVTVQWRNPNDANFHAARIYRNTSPTFGTAADVSGAIYGSPSAIDTYADEGLDPDTYYYWAVAENGSGLQSTPLGPDSVVVS